MKKSYTTLSFYGLGIISVNSIAGGAIEDIIVSVLMVIATTEGQLNTTAYMKIENECRCEEHALVAVYSPVAKTAELHTYISKDGRKAMPRIDEIILESNSKIVLKPGGLHVMLIGLKQAINEGDSVSLTLEFDDGSRLELIAPVKEALTLIKRPEHASNQNLSW